MTDERLGLTSASEIYRGSECHGHKILTRSLQENGLLPKRIESTEEATLGERIHASLEGYPEDLDRKAQETRDDCDRLAKLAEMEFFGRETMTDDVHYEERLWYTIGDIPFFSGKPDRFYEQRKDSRYVTLDILDLNFKTGRGEQEDSHLNLQLRTEVVLLKHRYPQSTRIGVATIQPLATKTPEIAVYDEQAMHQAKIEILRIVDAAAWDPARRAGPWCVFCPARAFCPEARELATVEPLKVDVKALPSGTEASEMLGRVKVAYKILDALKEAFKAKVMADPESVPGWYIAPGRKVRSLADENVEALKEVMWEQGMSEEDFRSVLSFSVTKFEDLVAKHWELKGKAFEAKFRLVFGELFSIRQNDPFLAPMPKWMLAEKAKAKEVTNE